MRSSMLVDLRKLSFEGQYIVYQRTTGSPYVIRSPFRYNQHANGKSCGQQSQL
jgi:hypothetical protein